MADQKIEPCPYCHGKCVASCGAFFMRVSCPKCGYLSKGARVGDMSTPELSATVIAAHNKVSRANAIAEAYGGLFDEVEELFRGHSTKWGLGGRHPRDEFDPLWQKYNKVLDAEDPEGQETP